MLRYSIQRDGEANQWEAVESWHAAWPLLPVTTPVVQTVVDQSVFWNENTGDFVDDDDDDLF
jgi:hypothetical protein